MSLLVSYLRKELAELHKNNVKILTIGDISKLPQACIDELNKSIDETKDNTGLVLSLALNYGSRADIKSAVTRIAKMVEEGKISIDDIDDEMISSSMSTRNIVDPDLVIRTSGEQRLSNFLLWEVAYSEFYRGGFYETKNNFIFNYVTLAGIFVCRWGPIILYRASCHGYRTTRILHSL